MDQDDTSHSSSTDSSTTHHTSDSTPVNRRSVLKTLGTAGAIGALGIPAKVAADATPSAAHVEQILEEPQVTRLREEIGSFTVESSSVTRRQEAETTITATTIETNLGTLTNVSIGSTEEAKFELDLSNNPELRRRLPTEFNPVPAECATSLVSDGSSVTFVRETTDNELAQLEEAVDAPIISAAYTSDISGFAVIAGTVSEETTDIRSYQVGVNGGNISPAAVEPVVTTQGCWGQCTSCAAAVVARGFCYVSCATVVSGATLAACIACITTTSFGLPYGCYTCIRCAG